MTTAATHPPAPRMWRSAHHFVCIGSGVHSTVFHRPGSRWVIQLFRRETPLTTQRLVREFEHLQATYSAMPDLVGPQRLYRPDASTPLDQTPLHETLLVKRYVDVDPAKALLTLHPDELTEPQQLDLAQFVTITRGQLARPLAGEIPDTGVPRLPDIIDDKLHNLAFDRDGRLRLLDTNELISTAHLYDLIGTNTTLDLTRRRIHAKFFTRLLLLETLTGRSRDELTADPLYRGYLTADQIQALIAATPPSRTPINAS